MTKIKTTTWTIEPHTEAKHAILRKYLDAWIPIITRWNGRVLYIDGFAGPGIYDNGQDGSPVIAIKSITDHTSKINSDIDMIFIEAVEDRYDHLTKKIKGIPLPPNLKIECINSPFNDAILQILNTLEGSKVEPPPAFVFIDPFGFTGIPFSTIKRIMAIPKWEVLITFMYEEINRFLEDDKLFNNMMETFGTDSWNSVREKSNPKERLIFLHNLYKQQLENEAEIKYVHSFQMINKSNKTDYFLFFGTNNITGLMKMKEAMWKVDDSGTFCFSDSTYNPLQPLLFENVPNYPKLKKILVDQYKGQIVKIQDLENFIIEYTPFRETHYKKNILKIMEQADSPEIKIVSGGKR